MLWILLVILIGVVIVFLFDMLYTFLGKLKNRKK